jgi:hypothetical protein
MKIGVMQPYFFPYIGYFQLINAVDVYVNLDHVSFMKRSYMVRNTLKNNTPINIPVLDGSQNKTCAEVNASADEKWFKKFERTLELLYKKDNNDQIILDEIILPWKNSILSINRPISISEFNFNERFSGKGWWGNKEAYQLGIKYIDVLNINNLDLQLEYNQASP